MKTNVSAQAKKIMTALALFALVSPAWAATQTVALAVGNMTCSACPITVKKALNRVDGVVKTEMNIGKREAQVTFDDAKTNVGTLIRATENAGYPSHVAGGQR